MKKRRKILIILISVFFIMNTFGLQSKAFCEYEQTNYQASYSQSKAKYQSQYQQSTKKASNLLINIYQTILSVFRQKTDDIANQKLTLQMPKNYGQQIPNTIDITLPNSQYENKKNEMYQKYNSTSQNINIQMNNGNTFKTNTLINQYQQAKQQIKNSSSLQINTELKNKFDNFQYKSDSFDKNLYNKLKNLPMPSLDNIKSGFEQRIGDLDKNVKTNINEQYKNITIPQYNVKQDNEGLDTKYSTYKTPKVANIDKKRFNSINKTTQPVKYSRQKQVNNKKESQTSKSNSKTFNNKTQQGEFSKQTWWDKIKNWVNRLFK